MSHTAAHPGGSNNAAFLDQGKRVNASISLSVILPCYNEAHQIEAVTRGIIDAITARLDDAEVVIVDDGSTDETPHVARRLAQEIEHVRCLSLPRNVGHGPAVLAGYRTARMDFVLQMDSDGQLDPADFWKLHACLPDADFVLGYRERSAASRQRRALSRMVRLGNLLLFGVNLRDANCPFRLMRRAVLDGLLPDIPGDAFAPNIMLSLLAARRGVRIRQVPVTHLARRGGSSTLRAWRVWPAALRALGQLLRWRRTI